ncbi:MAG: hypothetical protein IK041_07580 [Bacteroidales bacterium]|nr:hypothetical protein [Bacteroidales bacterium]
MADKLTCATGLKAEETPELLVLAFFIVVASSQICPPLCVIGGKNIIFLYIKQTKTNLFQKQIFFGESLLGMSLAFCIFAADLRNIKKPYIFNSYEKNNQAVYLVGYKHVRCFQRLRSGNHILYERQGN